MSSLENYKADISYRPEGAQAPFLLDMDEQLSPHQLNLLLQATAELGAMQALINAGKLNPYLSKAAAFRLYGRKNIERWLNEGLLTPRKDGNHSAGWRIDRLELELIAKARFLLQLLDL